MNLFLLSWSYIKNKALNTVLNTVLLALGVGIIIFLLLVQHQLQEKFQNDVKGIKLVIGAEGSPLQLILASIYHVDAPTGNIPLNEVEKFSEGPFIKSSIPLALGDSYKGFRIVGTNHDYPNHYECKLKEGKLWGGNLEVTIGSEVAKTAKLELGSNFAGAHGIVAAGDEVFTHDEFQYTVVGILESSGTVMDRLILTEVESVWKVHEEPEEESEEEEGTASEEIPEADSLNRESEDETPMVSEESGRDITSLLVTEYRNPLAAINLPRLVNEVGNLQSASPALEINRLFSLIGIGEQAIQIFAFIIIGIAALSIFIALYNALKERQYDLAIMRTLGASRAKLFTQIILEGLLLSSFGAILGFLLGHGTVAIISGMESVSDKIKLNPWIFLQDELFVLLLIFGVGLIASIIPAIQTYRIDISKTLSR